MSFDTQQLIDRPLNLPGEMRGVVMQLVPSISRGQRMTLLERRQVHLQRTQEDTVFQLAQLKRSLQWAFWIVLLVVVAFMLSVSLAVAVVADANRHLSPEPVDTCDQCGPKWQI